jgi:hypothetical protein
MKKKRKIGIVNMISCQSNNLVSYDFFASSPVGKINARDVIKVDISSVPEKNDSKLESFLRISTFSFINKSLALFWLPLQKLAAYVSIILWIIVLTFFLLENV